MAITNPDLIKKVKAQNDYCGLTKWHDAGITGKGIVVWDMEPITVDHGVQTRDRILDAAPNATVINASLVMSFNNQEVKYAYAQLADKTQIPVEEFIRTRNIKIMTRSVGGEFCGSPENADSKFWEKLKQKYNLIIFNSYGNEYDEQKAEKDTISVLVGACALMNGIPTRDSYSSTGQGIDFIDFKGWNSGTSFSTPYLAGKTALLLEKYGKDLTQDDIVQYWEDHCEDLQAKGWDSYTGHGLPMFGNVNEKYIFPSQEDDDMKKTNFTDVPEGSWYEEAIAYCVQKGYLKGTSETTFEPDKYLTRAQLAQVLYNMK